MPILKVRGQAMTSPQLPAKTVPPSPWKRWLEGALGAVVSGVTSGSVSQFVGVPWKKSLAIAGASAGVSLWKYLQQNPPPGVEA